MGFAFPAGAFLALLAIPLVLLYVLKLRRRPVSVSSTLLWRRVVEDRRANAPWERLRRHLLLLLQLLLLALLVTAFTGPYRRGQVQLAADTVLVLDGSASMLAQDPAGRSRFEQARAEAERLLDAVDSSRRLGLVLAGPQPRVLAALSSDVAGLRRALAGAKAAEAPADLAAALELAHDLVSGRSAGETILVTDGAFEAGPAMLELLSSARLILVGEGAPNAGIVSVALRSLPGSAGVQEVFAGLHWQGGPARSAELVLEARRADGSWATSAVTPLVLEPGRRHGRLFDVEALPGTELRLRLELEGGDALALDDQVQLVVPPPPEVRVLLVSQTPWLLSRALAAVPGVRLFQAEGLPEDADGNDLIVLDGVIPALLPPVPLLVFGAGDEGSGGLLATTGAMEVPRIVRWERRHPVLRHVDLDSVIVESAWRVEPPPGSTLLVETTEGPLASTWNGPGGPVLHFAFDLLSSDLPLRVAFPVLVNDAVDWLTDRYSASAVLPAGRPTELRIGETKGPARWSGPEGSERLLTVSAGTVRLPAAERTGAHVLRWTPSQPPGAAEMQRILPVALLSLEESELGRRLDPERLEERASADGPAPERAAGRHPLWPYLVALALVACLVEWTVHHRRPS